LHAYELAPTAFNHPAWNACVCGGCRYARLMHSLVDVLCRDREAWQRARCTQHPPLSCTAETHVLCESSLLTLLGPALILDHRLFKERAGDDAHAGSSLAKRRTESLQVYHPRGCKFECALCGSWFAATSAPLQSQPSLCALVAVCCYACECAPGQSPPSS
jgi:hypothetical protein